jgi:hypothetical protein
LRRFQLLLLAAAFIPPGGAPGWTAVPTTSGTAGWELAQPQRTAPRKPAPAPPAPPVAPSPPPTTNAEAPPARRPHRRVVRRGLVEKPPHVVSKPQRRGAVLAANAATSQPAYVSTLLLAALALAIACFACGAAPTGQIRWHRGAAFVADQRANITTVGVICLLAAAIVFVLARS